VSMGTQVSSVVVGMGGCTTIGTCLPSIRAAVGGEIACFTSSDHLRHRQSGEPITLAMMELTAKHTPVEERMMVLVRGAAEDALLSWSEIAARAGIPGYRLPVILCVPPMRPGFSKEAQIRLSRRIAKSLPVRFDASNCTLLNTGHESGLSALQYAHGLMGKDHLPACLVGGVDSYVDIDTLHWLEKQERLKGDEQAGGLIPGEGAGFLLICRKEFAVRHRLDFYAELVSLARGYEPAPWYVGKPTTGQGLTRTLQEVFKSPRLKTKRAEVTYCDMNGESWRAEEWSFAYLRTAGHHGEPLDLRHPADCWGDIGAASGILLVALAAMDLSCEEEKDKRALIWTASDVTPYRSACVIQV
jgi:3-oxoacyl-[acyl-carrier-protein] synthase-1